MASLPMALIGFEGRSFRRTNPLGTKRRVVIGRFGRWFVVCFVCHRLLRVARPKKGHLHTDFLVPRLNFRVRGRRERVVRRAPTPPAFAEPPGNVHRRAATGFLTLSAGASTAARPRPRPAAPPTRVPAPVGRAPHRRGRLRCACCSRNRWDSRKSR